MSKEITLANVSPTLMGILLASRLKLSNRCEPWHHFTGEWSQQARDSQTQLDALSTHERKQRVCDWAHALLTPVPLEIETVDPRRIAECLSQAPHSLQALAVAELPNSLRLHPRFASYSARASSYALNPELLAAWLRRIFSPLQREIALRADSGERCVK